MYRLVYLLQHVADAVAELLGFDGRQLRQVDLDVADAVRRIACLFRIEEFYRLARFLDQDGMDRKVDIAVRAGDFPHDRIIEERHVVFGDRDDRNLGATRRDAGDGFDRNLRLAAIPAGEFTMRMGCNQRQHVRRIKIEVIVAGPTEEALRRQRVDAQFDGGRLCCVDVSVPLRIVFHAHEVSPTHDRPNPIRTMANGDRFLRRFRQNRAENWRISRENSLNPFKSKAISRKLLENR
ncbi:hypothetical protein D9M72_525960 [compost metagenome]